MTTKAPALTASVLSRRIRAAGFPVTQTWNREGVRLSKGWTGGQVSVNVDFSGRAKETRVGDLLAEWLAENGYTFNRHGDRLALFTVTRPEAK